MGCRLFLLFLATALCIPALAQHSSDYISYDITRHEALVVQGDTLAQCTASFLAVLRKALQLEDRIRHYNLQQETSVLLASWLHTLQLGGLICLLLLSADNARLRRQLNKNAARFNAREQEMKAISNGIRVQAADLGERAVQGCQEIVEVVKQYNTLVDKFNALLLVLCNAMNLLDKTKEALGKLQAAPTPAKVNHHCHTNNLGVLASVPSLAEEAASLDHQPQLEAEASTPELSDLVAAASNHDTSKRKSDQVNTMPNTLKGTPGHVSSLSKLQSVQADVETLNQQLEEQGATYRLLLTPSAINPSAATASYTSPAAAAATAVVPAAVATAFKSPMAATPDMMPLPSPDAAVFYTSSSQHGQVGAVQQQALMPSSNAIGSQGSKFVTHDELKVMMLQTECQKLKEENKLLKEEVKIQHAPFQSPGITPLAAGYVNTRRGTATPPMPLHIAGGMPGSAGSFISITSGNAFNGRRSSTDIDSATASNSYFKLPGQHSLQQLPGSAGSTKQSPAAQAGAAGVSLTPSSSTTSCSGMGRTTQHTSPVRMQPLGDAASPACSPVRQQQTPSPAKESAAKKLSDAIDVFAKKPTRIRELADKSSKAVESQSTPKAAVKS